VTQPKDPQVQHPGRPDPAGEGKGHRPEPSRERRGPGATDAEKSEAQEPTDNRFPDADIHQESG
jgi:hypothetical protein